MAEQRPDRPTPKRGRPGNQNRGMPFRGLFGWVVFVTASLLIFYVVKQNRNEYRQISLDQFMSKLSDGKVASLVVQNDEIIGEFTAEQQIKLPPKSADKVVKVSKFRTDLPGGSSGQWPFVQWLFEHHKDAIIEVENTNGVLMQFLVSLLPWILIIGCAYFFLFRQLRNSAGAGGMLGSFGKAKAKIMSKEHTNVTFDDVAGIEEAKEEVMEIVEFLKNPKKFQRLGGRIPRGVLLVGEPGTGKTLLAKAIAGEADVPFFSISGSDFVEMFVGVGASRVRDLFKQAKDNSPCIIFLDEIDAVGRRRGSGFSSGGHDEREQTLNAILVEMDGFDTNDQVIVCAATNRVDVLDPALTRPGRFDRQIYVPLPDVKGRLEILKVHSRKVKLGPNVDLLRLARATPGFSGADLAAIINESALGATLAGKEYIEQDDLEEARDKVRWGRARKSRVIEEKEKQLIAYHEAGHAVVQYLSKDADPLHKVTIIPRGAAGGATFSLPEKDRMTVSRNWCIAQIKVCFGGRLAEQMFCFDANSGVASDIRQATSLARRMISEWGMSDRLGFIYYGEDDTRPNPFGDFGGMREHSEEISRVIDEEVKKLIDRLYEETRQLLEANREKIDALAKALLRYETLDSADVDRIMRGDNLTKPTVSDLLERENRRGAVIQPGTDSGEPDVQPMGGIGGGPLPAPG